MNHNRTIAAALMVMTGLGALQARELYGLTTTTWEEGNARVVSVNLDALSDNPEAPTPFTEISTFEHASDFMAGTSVGEKYYCYYNTYDQTLDLSLQYFGTLVMEDGEFTLIAEENHVTSDNVTDMIDMTYDPVGGGLLGLDRQYVPSETKFVSTIQNISMRRGTLSEVILLDRKYAGICSDGEGGFYLVELVREENDFYRPCFYKADNRFSITPMPVEGDIAGQNSFAHSMTTDGESLYLVSGSILTVVSLADRTASSYYLEKDLYGITLEMSRPSGIADIPTEGDFPAQYYTIDGRRLDAPEPGTIVICRKGPKAEKLIAR